MINFGSIEAFAINDRLNYNLGIKMAKAHKNKAIRSKHITLLNFTFCQFKGQKGGYGLLTGTFPDSKHSYDTLS